VLKACPAPRREPLPAPLRKGRPLTRRRHAEWAGSRCCRRDVGAANPPGRA
jgi:hypothetical protein